MRKMLAYLWMTAGLLAWACQREPFSGGACVPEGEPVDWVLSFGGASDVQIEPTKSTHNLEAESIIYNLYVFIFDMDNGGTKIYGHYFDYKNLNASTAPHWWEVENNRQEGDKLITSGAVHMHTISKLNCRVVAISNIDAEMVNISPEQLSTVEKYADLQGQKAHLNQLITSRSGYFPMSGELDGVNTGSEDLGNANALLLRRLDAKNRFNVYVDMEDDASPIAEFEPLKWRVVNIPKSAYILERGAYDDGNFSQASLVDASVSADDFFDQGETNFETQEVTDKYYSGSTIYRKFKHGFSFYMMENRKAPVRSMGTPPRYEDRDRQDKQGTQEISGIAYTENGPFTYAHPYSTYVVITGRVRMNNVEYKENTGATLSADVQYVVHLGDFSDGKNDEFNIFRNHSYTYDIIIRDVNDIRVEVSNNYQDGATLAERIAEPEPGASGRVSVAMEEIFTSDAHYSSHVITFHAKHIDPDKVSWLVKTPFNPSGASPVVGSNGVEITTGLDFEWVQFRVNDMDEDGIYFDDKRQIYKPMDGEYADGKTMNISCLVDYLKRQKRLYENSDTRAQSDFDATPEENGGPKISVTAFVNEYYYEENPITGETPNDLWKSFVNQPMRFMYILSETQTSADGESQIIGSSFTIQQKSIQSIYNIQNPELYSAWGSEHTDDEQERGHETYDKNGAGSYYGNSSMSNGRLNTLKLWGLLNADGSNRVMDDVTSDDAYWHHYMDLTAPNETPMMKEDYQYLRFSCMSRNRDNNGNGLIDLGEVRWYMGALNQLVGLFIGNYGIEGDSRLYQRNAQERASTDNLVWREHVISSSRFNNQNGPAVLWGEEGLSTGSINDSWNYGRVNRFSTRCVRNLGYDPTSGKDMTYAPVEVEPEDYIVTRRLRLGQEYSGSFTDDVYYEFDCSRLNEASLRYYTDRELAAHDEDSEQASLYKKFVTHSKQEGVNFGNRKINEIHDYLASNIGLNPYCPAGYRLPNIRELSVIRNFIPSSDVSGFISSIMPCRTHWSFGLIGEFYNSERGTGNRYGWVVSSEKVYMAEKNNQNSFTARCVKDVKQ